MTESILDIEIADPAWRRIRGLPARLEKAAGMTLSLLPRPLQFPATAVLLLTSDAAVKKLNRDFRGLNKPTNILSFPQFETPVLAKKGRRLKAAMMGDMVMGYQYIVAEARRDNKILINHVTHLLIHGLLHLFGYDHLSDKDAGRMERLEKKIMAGLSLPDPYKANREI